MFLACLWKKNLLNNSCSLDPECLLKAYLNFMPSLWPYWDVKQLEDVTFERKWDCWRVTLEENLKCPSFPRWPSDHRRFPSQSLANQIEPNNHGRNSLKLWAPASSLFIRWLLWQFCQGCRIVPDNNLIQFSFLSSKCAVYKETENFPVIFFYCIFPLIRQVLSYTSISGG